MGTPGPGPFPETSGERGGLRLTRRRSVPRVGSSVHHLPALRETIVPSATLPYGRPGRGKPRDSGVWVGTDGSLHRYLYLFLVLRRTVPTPPPPPLSYPGTGTVPVKSHRKTDSTGEESFFFGNRYSISSPRKVVLLLFFRPLVSGLSGAHAPLCLQGRSPSRRPFSGGFGTRRPPLRFRSGQPPAAVPSTSTYPCPRPHSSVR